MSTSQDPGRIYVDGALRRANSSSRIPVINPATEEVVGEIPDCDDADVDLAVGAARRALETSGWRDLTPVDRATHLHALADAIEKRGEDLGHLVTSENGMPLAMSVPFNGAGPARTYRYFADQAGALDIEEIRPSDGGHTIVRREPVGVAALITVWNGPQGSIAWKLAPALLAGCSVVIKPAPETSLDSLRYLVEALEESAIPGGVVNIVTGGRETGASLVRHPGVRKVAFTGSTAAGRMVAEACAVDMKRVTLELGGKSAAILLDDVDLDAFRPFILSACTPYSGQVCRALTRILAPRAAYDEVVDVVSDTLRRATVGDPLDPRTVFGPLVAERQRDRVEGYIASGIAEGAEVVVGGRRPAHLERGFYIEPTVFRGVDNTMRIAREEIFGPVVAVIPYDTEADAVQIANDSPYGLGGAVFTRDTERGTDVARRIETGTIGVNSHQLPLQAPFGGVKGSGIGRELGPEGLAAYLETKSIYRAGDPPA